MVVQEFEERNRYKTVVDGDGEEPLLRVSRKIRPDR
jgi:hypothetical protein